MATMYCSSSADSAPAPGVKVPIVWFFCRGRAKDKQKKKVEGRGRSFIQVRGARAGGRAERRGSIRVLAGIVHFLSPTFVAKVSLSVWMMAG